MKIVIAGPGAMGSLFAGMLCKAGYTVWLLARNEHRVRGILKAGLILETESQVWHTGLTTITSNPEAIGTADILIICVKAYDTAKAIHQALPVISEKTTVLTLQNGLGNIEKICEAVSSDQVLAGTTAHGATLLGDGHVRHAGTGETVIGAVNPAGRHRAGAVQKVFADSGIITTVSDTITSVLWGKLLINAGINPLTAIMRIKNGQILKYPSLCSIMRRAVAEVCDITDALKITLPFTDPVKRVEEVCRATADNISSMHQDIIAGRKTEIDHINGCVVSFGQTLHVPTPVNSMLTGLVKSIEQIQLSSEHSSTQ